MQKCSAQPGEFAGRVFWMCRSCYLESVEVPVFKAICTAKCNSAALAGILSFSGGPSSRLALHTIQAYMKGQRRKRLNLAIRAIHVEEGPVLGWSQSKIDHVRSTILSYIGEIDHEILPLLCIAHASIPAADCACESCQMIKGKLPVTPTVRLSLLRRAREGTLLQHAKATKSDYILTCGGVGRVAADIIGGVAEGRGGAMRVRSALAYRLGGSEENAAVLWLQPMREALPTEVSTALSLIAANPTEDIADVRREFGTNTVASLASEFVLTLQKDKPHIVHTLLRTIEKLSIKTDDSKVCAFCLCPYQPGLGARGDKSSATLCSACASLPPAVIRSFGQPEDEQATTQGAAAILSPVDGEEHVLAAARAAAVAVDTGRQKLDW